MEKHPRHAERVRHRAGVLAGGAAETAQSVLADVVAALDRDLLDGVSHVLDGDGEESGRDLMGAALGARCGGDLGA